MAREPADERPPEPPDAASGDERRPARAAGSGERAAEPEASSGDPAPEPPDGASVRDGGEAPAGDGDAATDRQASTTGRTSADGRAEAERQADADGSPGGGGRVDAGEPEADGPGTDGQADTGGFDTRGPDADGAAREQRPVDAERQADADGSPGGGGRADAGGSEAGGSVADGPVRERRPVETVTAVAVAASIVAAGFAAYYGWSWYRVAHDESLRFSRARDAVVRAADQGVQNLNTLDYRKADEGFTTWERSSTGALHDQLVQGRAQFEEQVRQARTVTTAKILETAVTDLDTRTGKAGVIVALQITVTPATGQPTTKPSRMRAQLARTSSGWKLSALGQAPVGTTGSGG